MRVVNPFPSENGTPIGWFFTNYGFAPLSSALTRTFPLLSPRFHGRKTFPFSWKMAGLWSLAVILESSHSFSASFSPPLPPLVSWKFALPLLFLLFKERNVPPPSNVWTRIALIGPPPTLFFSSLKFHCAPLCSDASFSRSTNRPPGLDPPPYSESLDPFPPDYLIFPLFPSTGSCPGPMR